MEENVEGLSEEQINILNNYVSSTTGNVFVLFNLPEVIKGALFSRYSRSTLGLRALLLKEFLSSDESGFQALAEIDEQSSESKDVPYLALKKAQNFYDRILDGFGDDSVGEMGGAHLAVENVSMIAAKAIEDSRIGGSPLEKSTRYIYFDQKVNGEYMFYREPILMTSAYRNQYIDTCNMLFDTYSNLIPPLTELMKKKFPKDGETSQAAYTSSLRAKVLDCLRGLLPASTMTNLGLYGNGRFFEYLIHKMECHNLAELQSAGKEIYNELAKVIPSFVRRSEPSHKYHQSFAEFTEAMEEELNLVTQQYTDFPKSNTSPGVRLISSDHEAATKVAASLMYKHCDKGLEELEEVCAQLPEEDLDRIFDAATNPRENRRHKSPRALERAEFCFEIIADFGVYRDLQRHRMTSQQRQLLSCNYGYFIPQEILGTDMEANYRIAMDKAREAYTLIAKELPEEAQYIVPMAYNIRWYFHINLRELQWLCEMRSASAGHINYRHIAQKMAQEVIAAYPHFESFFKFVDYEGYDLGRLSQEQRIAEKKSKT
ncbi:MAG: FAD-dependent thymidylate synthase [Chlamydiota bacterium]